LFGRKTSDRSKSRIKNYLDQPKYYEDVGTETERMLHKVPA